MKHNPYKRHRLNGHFDTSSGLRRSYRLDYMETVRRQARIWPLGVGRRFSWARFIRGTSEKCP
jgi:hypothetical protein